MARTNTRQLMADGEDGPADGTAVEARFGKGRGRAATEEQLLDAAVRVFASRGYDVASIQEIANVAGVSVAHIDREFGDKEDLLVAITERVMECRRYGVFTYPPQATLGDEVYQYLHYRLYADRANAAVVRLLVSRIAIDEKFRRRTLKSFTAEADENFRERMQALKNTGSLDPGANIDTLFATVTYLSAATKFFGALVQNRTDDEIDEIFAEFAVGAAQGADVTVFTVPGASSTTLGPDAFIDFGPAGPQMNHGTRDLGEAEFRLANLDDLTTHDMRPLAAIDYMKVYATALDLSDLGVGEGETIDMLVLSSSGEMTETSDGPRLCWTADPILVVGLPPSQ